MRKVVMGLAAALFAGDAIAADYLRGSTYESAPAGYRWSGVYFGGQFGHSTANFKFTDATKPLVAELVRALLVEEEANISQLTRLGSTNQSNSSWGLFVGYNAQWTDVVLGVEVNYNRFSAEGASSDLIARSFVTSNEFRNDVVIGSDAWAKIREYGTLRFRAGYAWGWLMPYGMAGLAIGNFNYRRSAGVSITETDVSAAALDPTDGIPPRDGGALNVSATDAKNNAIALGYMVGAGLEVGVMPGVFLRGEFEFVQFLPIGGITTNLSTFRAGAGVKF